MVIEVDTGDAPVRALFSTREGGVSTGGHASLNLGATSGDHPDAVRANRDALARATGFDPLRAVALAQVHGAEVFAAEAGGGAGTFTGSIEGVAECDAAVTRAPGVALLAMGADCPVIALWSDDGSVVAAVHAGWRGITGGVIAAGVGAMGVGADAVHASVGPHVGPCCYPVDAELRQAMAHAYGADVVVGDAVDLGLACRRALEHAGLAPEGIHVEDACTACDEARFFSYRRDGAATGRQAAVVWIEEGT